MKISDVKEKTKGVDDKILELIDLKTEDDMKQIISQLQSTERSVASQLQLIEKSVATQLQLIEKAIEASEKKHTLVLWVVGLAFAVLATIVALK